MCLGPFNFYKQIYSGLRNRSHRQWKIAYNFEMKWKIKIRRHSFVGNPSDNNLVKFQPNWSRGCRLGGVQNVYAQLAQISYREKRKNRISTVMRLAAPKRQANKVLIDKRQYQFSWTIVVWQVTRNWKILAAVGNFLIEINLPPRPTQQFISWA